MFDKKTDQYHKLEALRELIREKKMIMIEYRGWKISPPYICNEYMGFMIYKEELEVSIIFNERGWLSYSTDLCNCQFDTLDEVITHLDVGGCNI